MKKRNNLSLVVRLLVVAAVLCSFLVAVQPALAATNITETLDPSPDNALLNTGVGVQSIWWKIACDSVPSTVVHKIIAPDGITVMDTHTWDNVSGGFEDIVVLSNLPDSNYVIYNPEDSSGGNQGGPGHMHTYAIPAGAPPGRWTSRIEYYSTGGFEKSADEVFLVRQPLTIFKYNDLNGNGAWDEATEPGLDNWTFRITGPDQNSDPSVVELYDQTVDTSSGGYIELLGGVGDPLPAFAIAGDYVITETLKDGWVNTDPGEPGDPLLNQKTITIPGEVIDNRTPMVMLGNMEFFPDTIVTINASPNSLPDGGGTVDLTITEYNMIGSTDLTGVHVQITGADSPIDNRTFSNVDTFSGGDEDSTLEPGETWRWVIHNVPVTVDPTIFVANGHGYYGDPAVDVSWATGHEFERAQDIVEIRPPTHVPGLSGFGIGILIAVFGMLMGLFVYRRTRQAKN